MAHAHKMKWDYPLCIGAVDGKHIAIHQPPGSGSEFFNYKHFFSVLLLAVADANYKFIYVDVGAAGRSGDAGVFNRTPLKNAMAQNLLDLPPPECLQASDKVHYHMIGDDAFPLKPYPHRKFDKKCRIFNYRLSRARRVIENSFGIFSNRFRLFHTTINLNPDKVTTLILSTCCLHNYLIEKRKHSYLHACNAEDQTNHNVISGVWRTERPLTGISPTADRNPTALAKKQRQCLTDYFSTTEGCVP